MFTCWKKIILVHITCQMFQFWVNKCHLFPSSICLQIKVNLGPNFSKSEEMFWSLVNKWVLSTCPAIISYLLKFQPISLDLDLQCVDELAFLHTTIQDIWLPTERKQVFIKYITEIMEVIHIKEFGSCKVTRSPLAPCQAGFYLENTGLVWQCGLSRNFTALRNSERLEHRERLVQNQIIPCSAKVHEIAICALPFRCTPTACATDAMWWIRNTRTS